MSTLKLVTWNINNRSDGAEVINRLEQINKEHEPDVILLQELTVDSVFNNDFTLPKDIAEQLGFNHHFVAHEHKSVRFKEGVGVFSVHPLRNKRQRIVNERRAIALADIELEGHHITFGSVHLSSPMVNPVAFVKELNMFEDYALNNGYESFILAGDFNTAFNHGFSEAIDEAMHVYAPDEHSYKGKWVGKEHTLDYVLTSTDFKCKNDEALDPKPSDHRPYIVELEFNS